MTFPSLVCAAGALAVAATAAAEPVRHVPPAEALAGNAVELVASAPATTPTLVAHVRARLGGAFAPIELVRRDGTTWVAVVPAASVAAPGFEYYVSAGPDPVFGSARSPHPIAVRAGAGDARRGRDQQRTGGRRSRVQAMGEWIDYDMRDPVEQADRYYRIDVDFAYRLWSYPLEEIRVGYTRLLGTTRRVESMPCTDACNVDAGFKVAGWFELGLAPVEGVHLDGRMMVMATQDGFAVGGRGVARLGARDSSHVALGAEHLATVGTNGFFRLGWGTVPRLPMAATVEVTNLPASHRRVGVRLYYDLARQISEHVRIGLRVGYAARYQSDGGVTGGAGATVEF